MSNVRTECTYVHTDLVRQKRRSRKERETFWLSLLLSAAYAYACRYLRGKAEEKRDFSRWDTVIGAILRRWGFLIAGVGKNGIFMKMLKDWRAWMKWEQLTVRPRLNLIEGLRILRLRRRIRHILLSHSFYWRVVLIFSSLIFKKSFTHFIMSEFYKNRQNRIFKTLDVFQKKFYKSAVECAWEHDISTRLFQRRLKLKDSKLKRSATYTRLFETQETTIKKYIEYLDNLNILFKQSMIRDAVNYLLRQIDSLASRVSRNWTFWFLKQNLQFHVKKKKSLTVERKNVHSVENLKKYFEAFCREVEIFELTSNDIWNMNETNFRVNCESNSLIMTFLNRSIVITDSDNRDYVIVVEYINVWGTHMLSCLFQLFDTESCFLEAKFFWTVRGAA